MAELKSIKLVEVAQEERRDMSDYLDALDGQRRYAQTLTHMLYDLLNDQHDKPDLDVNDPASVTQRMYACVEAIQDRLAAIGRIEEDISSL